MEFVCWDGFDGCGGVKYFEGFLVVGEREECCAELEGGCGIGGWVRGWGVIGEWA